MRPWRSWGPRSVTAAPSMPSEKSQAPSRPSSGRAADGRSASARSLSGLGADPTSTGPSTLPLKWAPLIQRPCDGHPECAPTRTGVPGGGARHSTPPRAARPSSGKPAQGSRRVHSTRAVPVPSSKLAATKCQRRSRSAEAEVASDNRPPAPSRRRSLPASSISSANPEPPGSDHQPRTHWRRSPGAGAVGQMNAATAKAPPSGSPEVSSIRTYDPASMGWKRPRCSPSAGLGAGTRSSPGPRGSGSPQTIRTKSRR